MPYSDIVLDHFRQPRHAGRKNLAGQPQACGEAGQRQGDGQVVFYLSITDDIIRDARFEAFGCPYIIATADYVAGLLIGRPTKQGLTESAQHLADALELPAEKLGRVFIVEDAVKAALDDWRSRQA